MDWFQGTVNTLTESWGAPKESAPLPNWSYYSLYKLTQAKVSTLMDRFPLELF